MEGWSTYYPPDCPPLQADDISGEVYRFTKTQNPTENDFKPLKILCPNQIWSNQKKECESCGLSVLRTREDCIDMRRKVPSFKKKFISVANLSPSHGKIKNTPSERTIEHHFTWWIPVSVLEPWKLFQVTGE